MSKWPEDYIEFVLDDIEYYKDKRKIVKAGLIERCAIRHINPQKLHPNPEDEFSMEEFGPNFGIVGKYVELIKHHERHGLDIFDEPVVVEKMESGGYMLLNGHHRWMAAMRLRIKKMRIQIVNLVHAEDMGRMLEKTTNTSRVAFDFDEVLLAREGMEQAEITDKLFERHIKERLRKGAPEVIRALQEKGIDVWVYTAGYNSEEHINDFFSMYEIEITGVVNGMNDKRRKDNDEGSKIKEMLANKYVRSLHVDEESVLSVESESGSYEQYDIFEGSKDWAEGILSIINSKL